MRSSSAMAWITAVLAISSSSRSCGMLALEGTEHAGQQVAADGRARADGELAARESAELRDLGFGQRARPPGCCWVWCISTWPASVRRTPRGSRSKSTAPSDSSSSDTCLETAGWLVRRQPRGPRDVSLRRDRRECPQFIEIHGQAEP